MKRLLVLLFVILSIVGCGSKSKKEERSSIPPIFVVMLVVSVAINVYFIVKKNENNKQREKEKGYIWREDNNRNEIIKEMKSISEKINEQENQRMNNCLNKFNKNAEDIEKKIYVCTDNIIKNMNSMQEVLFNIYSPSNNKIEINASNQSFDSKIMYATLNNDTSVLYSKEDKEQSSQFKLIQKTEDEAEFELILDKIIRQQDINNACEINGAYEGKGYMTIKRGVARKDGVDQWNVIRKTLIEYIK